jgi:hypothetical protein
MSKRILVVEDDPDNREIIRHIPAGSQLLAKIGNNLSAKR